jgi:hypothetical protein
MNKPSSKTKPNTKFGKYIIEDGTVQFDQGNGQYLLVMMGEVYVDGFVVDSATNTTTCVVAITPYVAGAQPCMERIDLAKLSNPKALSEILGSRGIIVCDPIHVPKYLRESVKAADKRMNRQLVKNTCWVANRRAFFTGRKLIVSDGIDADAIWIESSRMSPMCSRGTLKKWRSRIGNLIVENPILLAMTCIAIESIFLDRLGLSSSIFNFYGQKGLGKTLAQQCAASVFGNAVDPAQGAQVQDPPYIARFNGTLSGFENLLGRYSPLPVLLDEMTEGSSSIIYQVAYMMASGQSKHRSTPGGDAAQRESWQTNIIVSAEISIADTIAESGKKMHGGQADRASDIPTSDVGVVNNFGSFGSFSAVTSHLKRACGEQYGTPAEAIIQYCCDNPEEVDQILSMAPEVENVLLPADCGPGERRVVKRFAGAVVAGRIAVKAGVFDEDDVEKIDAAIKLVTDLWWGTRAGALTRIRTFLDENIDEIQIGKPELGCEVVAFVDDDLTVIPINVFNREFGDDGMRILDELAGLSALKKEQAKRYAHRFCNNGVRGYAIFTRRIWPDLEQPAA